MKKIIYILFFLSLHSCKTFYLRQDIKSLFSNKNKFDNFLTVDFDNDEHSDNNNSEKPICSLNLFLQCEDEVLYSQTVVFLTLSFQDFFIIKDDTKYLPRDLPDKYPVPSYIFSKSLVI